MEPNEWPDYAKNVANIKHLAIAGLDKYNKEAYDYYLMVLNEIIPDVGRLNPMTFEMFEAELKKTDNWDYSHMYYSLGDLKPVGNDYRNTDIRPPLIN